MAEQIAVTTEEIRKRKEDFLFIWSQMERKGKEISELFQSLWQFFSGKPVEAVIGREIKEREKGRKAFDNLKIQIEKLEEISRCYEEAERSNTNVT